MQNNLYLPLTIVAAAILSGCNSVPQNSSLTDAHSSYSKAQGNSQVTELAAIELQEAGNSLSKADRAMSNGESDSTVHHLAYIANQQVAIAQETAKRKVAEIAVTNASAKRDKIRLEARTAEADTAQQQVASMQKTADWQAAELAAASANADRDQDRLAARSAEADAAQQQVATMQKAADQQTAALATADAKASRDQDRLAASSAETDAAQQQVATMQKAADQQTAALATAGANAQRDQALIAQQELLLNELNAKKTARGLVITLGDVLFGANLSQLKSGGLRNVQKLADFLKQYPQHMVLIEGYTDSIGSDSLNQKLSDQRASTVRTALLDKGISSDRVTTRGYGEEFPVSSNSTAAGRQSNRRVEIIISDESGNIAPR